MFAGRSRKESMTTIATAPRVPGTLAGIPPFARPAAVIAGDRVTPFLAPPTTEDHIPVRHASACDEKAMHRLRNPFTVMIDAALERGNQHIHAGRTRGITPGH
ncbi:hypothetical protein ACTOB_008583 [Actinoplanes oblitus]|uniref:Uncharacterized protein n=1 Tax=Actinoplanes oblitus TaxID=3040509 RepID=A0ABY8WH44_9ACTN|nr:hypothetical protein [Actinoplanes oblitus]WIM96391.1 hypothetical protein ACTOB_008583 [Actinoplanes oblitus]